MTRLLARLAAGALLIGCTHFASAANILGNPGFETGNLGPWVLGNDFGGTELWNATNATSHTGSYSATAVGNVEIVQWFSAVAVEDVLGASMWLKMDTDNSIAFISLHYSDNSEGGAIFNIGSEWALYDVTSLLEAGKSLVGFGVYGCTGCGGSSRTFMDDASILTDGQVPEPATLALLGMGFAALSVARRKT